MSKKVFVTVGTTKFDELINCVTSTQILKVLSEKGYNQLTLQIGKSTLVPDCIPRDGFNKIEFFNLSSSIKNYMESADLIISHAGAGSCLEALEAKKSLVVVTNQTLMHNHQMELAEQLCKDGHLFCCTCETLLDTLKHMESSKLKSFVNEKSEKIARLVDEIMGFPPLS